VENLGWGLQMTVVGMGLVFALLAALWGLLNLVLRFDAPPVPSRHAATPAPTAAPARGMDADLVAAITVAVLTHKAVRRHQAAPAMRSYWPGSLLYASRWVATGRARQNRSWRGRR
jgi:glutaconyl-CoA/methylmalonyl-CoA decarboxylase subunit delta